MTFSVNKAEDRGAVSLANADPQVAPTATSIYLADVLDLQRLIAAVHFDGPGLRRSVVVRIY